LFFKDKFITNKDLKEVGKQIRLQVKGKIMTNSISYTNSLIKIEKERTQNKSNPVDNIRTREAVLNIPNTQNGTITLLTTDSEEANRIQLKSNLTINFYHIIKINYS
jgi:exopolysaccharide biosynthesis protein